MTPLGEVDAKQLMERLEAIEQQLRLQRCTVQGLLTLDEVGKVLGVSTRTIERFVQAGHLAVVRLPSATGNERQRSMIQSSDLQAFIDRHKQAERLTPPPAPADARSKPSAQLRIPSHL